VALVSSCYGAASRHAGRVRGPLLADADEQGGIRLSTPVRRPGLGVAPKTVLAFDGGPTGERPGPPTALLWARLTVHGETGARSVLAVDGGKNRVGDERPFTIAGDPGRAAALPCAHGLRTRRPVADPRPRPSPPAFGRLF